MDESSGLAWWTALRPRPQTPPDADDRADMGTAFGLDASLAPAAADTPAMPADPTAPTPAPPWEHRLVRRTGL